jgi:hypothetical protein
MDTATFYKVDHIAGRIYRKFRRQVSGVGRPMWTSFRNKLYAEMQKINWYTEARPTPEDKVLYLAYSKVADAVTFLIHAPAGNQGAEPVQRLTAAMDAIAALADRWCDSTNQPDSVCVALYQFTKWVGQQHQ